LFLWWGVVAYHLLQRLDAGGVTSWVTSLPITKSWKAMVHALCSPLTPSPHSLLHHCPPPPPPPLPSPPPPHTHTPPHRPPQSEASCKARCLEDLASTTRYVTWSLHTRSTAALRSTLLTKLQLAVRGGGARGVGVGAGGRVVAVGVNF
jgi:hypothetical protein